MTKFTFPTESQLWGKKKLKIIRETGLPIEINDFTKVCGGLFDTYWSSSLGRLDRISCVGEWGQKLWHGHYEQFVAARPILPFSEVSSITPNRIGGNILEVPYKHIPHTVVDWETEDKLNFYKKQGKLRVIGTVCTVNSKPSNAYDSRFEPRNLEGYIFEGKIYTEMEYLDNNEIDLSHGNVISRGSKVFLDLRPSILVYDEQEQVPIFKEPLFAGVKYDDKLDFDENFENTNISRYMEQYLFAYEGNILGALQEMNTGEEQRKKLIRQLD